MHRRKQSQDSEFVRSWASCWACMLHSACLEHGWEGGRLHLNMGKDTPSSWGSSEMAKLALIEHGARNKMLDRQPFNVLCV
eukprot:1137333-Pelagomonas_calceolata.AAC.10